MSNIIPDPEKLQEAKQVAEQIKTIFEQQSSAASKVNDALNITLSTGESIKDELEAIYGAQFNYMTLVEKQIALQEIVTQEQENRLKQQEEFLRLKEKEANTGIAMSDAEKERLRQLEAINTANGNILDVNRDQIKALREQLEEQKKITEQLQKQDAALKDVGKRFDEQLTSTFGLTENAQTLTQSIFKAGMEGNSLSDVFGAMKDKVKNAFTPLKIGLAIMNQLTDMSNRLQESFGAGGFRTKLAELNKDFVQATGLTMDFATEVQNLQVELISTSGIMLGESSKAINALNDNFVDFTEISSSARNELVEVTARLTRLGVDANTSSELVSNLSKSMGKSTESSLKLTKSMTNFARAINVGPNKMLGMLNKNFNLVAKFGEKKGVEIFKKLAMNAKATGLEFEKLVGITKTFDTFEGAAENAGKLNHLLGGPFLNSTQLVMASTDDALQMISEAFEKAGKSMDNLNRFEIEAIAGQLNITESELGKLLDAKNIKKMKDMSDGIDAKTAAMKSLGEETDDVLKRQQIQQQTEEKTAAAMFETTKKINDLLTDLDKLKGSFAEFFGILEMLSPILIPLIALLGFTSGAFAGIAAKVALLPTAIGVAALEVQAFFMTTLPTALSTAGSAVMTFFTTTLPTAASTAITYVTGTLIPGIITFFTVTLPVALSVAASAVGTFFTVTVPAAFTTLMTFMSTVVIPPIVTFFTVTLPVALSTLGGMFMTFIGTALTGLGTLATAFFTAMAPVVAFFGSMLAGLASVTIAFLTNPIGIAIMAIVGVLALLYTYWDDIVGAFMSGLKLIGDLWDSTVGAIGDLISYLGGLWDSTVGVMGDLWNSTVGIMGDLWDSTVGGITNAISYLGGLWDSTVGAMGEVWDSITGGIKSAWDSVTGFFSSSFEAVKGMFSGLGSFIAKTMVDALLAIPTAVAMGLDWVADKFAAGLNYLIKLVPEKIRSFIGIELLDESGGLGLTAGVDSVRSSLYSTLGVQGYKDGVNSAPGGLSVVGEEGPEMMYVPTGTEITPAQPTQTMMDSIDTFNKIIKNNAAMTAARPEPAQTQNKNTNLNETINIVLDGEVLARHTRQITIDTMEQALKPQTSFG